MTSDLPDSIHSHPVTHTEPAAYCEKDGDMTTFVDDSTSYFGHTNPLKVKEVTQKNYDLIEDYMNSNLLKINGDNSHLIVLTKGNGVAGGVAAAGRRAQVSLVAGGKVIRASEQETLLGGVIHQSGNWRMFIRDGKGSIIKQISTRIGALKIIRKNADFKTRLMVANGLVQAKLTYLLPLFGAAPDYLLRSLQVQQLAAARVVIGHACYMWSTEKILQTVSWLSVRQLHKYSLLLLTHRVITTKKPEGLYSLFETTFPYNTRRVQRREDGMTHTPIQIRCGERFGQVTPTSLCGRSFRHQAIIYNRLPAMLRSMTIEQLKPKLKQWIKGNVAVK